MAINTYNQNEEADVAQIAEMFLRNPGLRSKVDEVLREKLEERKREFDQLAMQFGLGVSASSSAGGRTRMSRAEAAQLKERMLAALEEAGANGLTTAQLQGIAGEKYNSIKMAIQKELEGKGMTLVNLNPGDRRNSKYAIKKASRKR